MFLDLLIVEIHGDADWADILVALFFVFHQVHENAAHHRTDQIGFHMFGQLADTIGKLCFFLIALIREFAE